ncbi:hypothetical protein X831_gp134 [Pseudomonas phage PAK_P2]|uniref:Uncharacterized protein n=9 Tax=Viruses TaxID=10239 RepID=A0A1J0ME39_9CAUD|nr:hypothetical protein X831_gp134 [Pseudomonas phage PAK_P2]YP_009598060.1 hypothetical protein FDH21_gp008 [Pseudomonas phage Zigelbrucke]YP_010763269.1 hypothetical protein QE329_gp109 [Pseudomonas phage PhL_UNISO_PA-DSM_ph0034]YP_010763994.1 hypothetical protein QE333_gp102 [Pseudomonas phage vB_PaeM_B31]YP_010765248.1 hypothetical protein QE347_gp140 [Pseudomonas phage vB_Paer_Ps12]YP_010765444.1 wall associated receptor kinase like 20-like protein [Pseudomonas phage vB_Paer_PsIn]YP_0107
MRSVAELIKMGLEDYLVNDRDTYMCYILSDLAEEGQISHGEYRSFREWLLEEHGIPSWDSVISLLHRNYLLDTDLNWVNFYVWSYFDLIRKEENNEL